MDLIVKYPREVEPYRRLIQATKQDDTGQYPALVDRFQKGIQDGAGCASPKSSKKRPQQSSGFGSAERSLP